MERVNRLSDKNHLRLRLALYILAALALFCIPREWMQDEGESVCLSKRLFNMECYGCGLTRATLAIIHGDFAAAWALNSRAFIVVPLLAFLYLKRVVKLFREILKTPL